MKKFFTRAGLWALWGLFVFIGAVHVHFPDDEIVEGLPYMVETASGGEWALDVGDADLLWWLSGAVVNDVVLYSVEQPEGNKGKKRKGRRGAKQAEDEGPPPATGPIALKPFLVVDEVEASVSPLSLMFGDTLDVDFDMQLHGGDLKGSYQRGAEHFDVSWQSSQLDVASLPLEVPGLIGLKGSGTFTTQGQLKRFAAQSKKDSGSFRFDFPQLFASQLTFNIAGIDANVYDATFSKASIAGTIQNGKLNLTEGSLLSDKVELNLSGEMTMNNRDMSTWKVRFEMNMNPLGDDFKQLLSFASSSLKAAKGEDGLYYFVCSGTWATMECNPDRSVVGGAKVPTTPKTSARRDSSSRRTPTTRRSADVSRDDDDDSSGSDAEARRQERLERIRERREERRMEREAAREGEDMMDEDELGPEFLDDQGDVDFPDGIDLPPIHQEDELYGLDDEEYFGDDLPPEDPDMDFIED